MAEGDWVTITRVYAVEHGRSHLSGDFKIKSKTVGVPVVDRGQ